MLDIVATFSVTTILLLYLLKTRTLAKKLLDNLINYRSIQAKH